MNVVLTWHRTIHRQESNCNLQRPRGFTTNAVAVLASFRYYQLFHRELNTNWIRAAYLSSAEAPHTSPPALPPHVPHSPEAPGPPARVNQQTNKPSAHRRSQRRAVITGPPLKRIVDRGNQQKKKDTQGR